MNSRQKYVSQKSLGGVIAISHRFSARTAKFGAFLALGLAFCAPSPAGAATQQIAGGSGFIFDPSDTFGGGLLYGDSPSFSPAYEKTYRLAVNGTEFVNATGTLSPDGRTVSYPLTALGNGFSVSRTFYVPNEDEATQADYGRYLDCVKNTSASTQSVDVTISGSLYNSQSIYATADGDTLLETNDSWFGTDDSATGGSPALAHVMGTKGLSYPRFISSSYMDWHLNVASLKPAASACFLTYAVQGKTRADAQALAAQLAAKPDIKGIAGTVLPLIQNYALSADIAVFPASGSAVHTANFDADIVLTGPSFTLNKGVAGIKLNGSDVSGSCGPQKTLLNVTRTASIGKVIHCPSVSNLLTKPGKNTFAVTYTSTNGAKATNTTTWTLYPVK